MVISPRYSASGDDGASASCTEDNMADERFLITGALGCVGAWATKLLLDEGVPVWSYDLPGKPHRMQLLMDDDAISRVNFIEGDITDQERFEQAVVENKITHILHMAALQVPMVRANPVQGARVNVVGSTIVLETAKRHMDQVAGLCFASSVAVYGPPDLYPPGAIQHDAPHLPTTLYGVQKMADEWTARVYWQDYGLRSIGIRPYFIYGPGRDQGMSSTPTKAMASAAARRPYHISFRGTAVYQHAEDVAAASIRSARTPVDGAPTFNLGGTVASMDDVDRRDRRRGAGDGGRDHRRADRDALPGGHGRHAAGSGDRQADMAPFQRGRRRHHRTLPERHRGRPHRHRPGDCVARRAPTPDPSPKRGRGGAWLPLSPELGGKGAGGIGGRQRG